MKPKQTMEPEDQIGITEIPQDKLGYGRGQDIADGYISRDAIITGTPHPKYGQDVPVWKAGKKIFGEIGGQEQHLTVSFGRLEEVQS